MNSEQKAIAKAIISANVNHGPPKDSELDQLLKKYKIYDNGSTTSSYTTCRNMLNKMLKTKHPTQKTFDGYNNWISNSGRKLQLTNKTANIVKKFRDLVVTEFNGPEFVHNSDNTITVIDKPKAVLDQVAEPKKSTPESDLTPEQKSEIKKLNDEKTDLLIKGAAREASEEASQRENELSEALKEDEERQREMVNLRASQRVSQISRSKVIEDDKKGPSKPTSPSFGEWAAARKAKEAKDKLRELAWIVNCSGYATDEQRIQAIRELGKINSEDLKIYQNILKEDESKMNKYEDNLLRNRNSPQSPKGSGSVQGPPSQQEKGLEEDKDAEVKQKEIEEQKKEERRIKALKKKEKQKEKLKKEQEQFRAIAEHIGMNKADEESKVVRNKQRSIRENDSMKHVDTESHKVRALEKEKEIEEQKRKQLEEEIKQKEEEERKRKALKKEKKKEKRKQKDLKRKLKKKKERFRKMAWILQYSGYVTNEEVDEAANELFSLNDEDKKIYEDIEKEELPKIRAAEEEEKKLKQLDQRIRDLILSRETDKGEQATKAIKELSSIPHDYLPRIQKIEKELEPEIEFIKQKQAEEEAKKQVEEPSATPKKVTIPNPVENKLSEEDRGELPKGLLRSSKESQGPLESSKEPRSPPDTDEFKDLLDDLMKRASSSGFEANERTRFINRGIREYLEKPENMITFETYLNDNGKVNKTSIGLITKDYTIYCTKKDNGKYDIDTKMPSEGKAKYALRKGTQPIVHKRTQALTRYDPNEICRMIETYVNENIDHTKYNTFSLNEVDRHRITSIIEVALKGALIDKPESSPDKSTSHGLNNGAKIKLSDRMLKLFNPHR